MSEANIDISHRVALVTGATGFVGTHLTRRLVREGWEVHIASRLGSLLPDDSEFSKATNHVHDGTTEGMVKLVGGIKPTVVFHLASLFLSQHQSGDIEPLISSNILFGSQILEAMHANGVKYLVNTGTSWQHFDNKDYSPVCLYAATKQAFEAMVSYYVDACGFRAITLKLYDTYGPDDPRPKLFHLLDKVAKSEQPLAMSPGEQLIDLVYIDDVIEAYLNAAGRLLTNTLTDQEFYAVSSGNPIELKELVGTYEEIVGKTLPINWGERAYRNREVMVPWNRGRWLPGWVPKIQLEVGIKRLMCIRSA